MDHTDRMATELAVTQGRMITRRQYLDLGGNDDRLGVRLRRKQITVLHPGVYLWGLDQDPLPLLEQVRAAVLAAGDGAQASHRAALMLWGLDGIAAAPVELTVPYEHRAAPKGTILHRSRRSEPASVIHRVPVTSVERTLLEVGTVVTPRIVEKAYASAIRKGLTTQRKLELYLEQHGGKGRAGTTLLREVAANYHEQPRMPGSAGAVEMAELLRRLREHGIEDPVFEHHVRLPDGTVFAVDVAWPVRRKGLEVDSLDHHASADQLDADLERNNLLADAGFGLRRFSVRMFRRQPERVLTQVLRFLCT